MRNWIIVGVVFIATSCSLIKNESEGIIDQDKIVDVLVDIHFADAIIAEKGFRVSSDSARIYKYYDDVMKKHNITRRQFDNTINYYTKHSLEYKDVYDEVIEKMTEMQKEFTEDKTPH